MDLQNFGQYLLDQKVTTPNQLLRAFEFQEQASPRFCEAAITLGLLSEEGRSRMLQLQVEQGGRVGEVAVRAGLLNAHQTEQVLRYQKSSHLMVGEALVSIGALSQAELGRHLNQFRRAQFAWVNDGLPGGFDPTGLMAPAVLATMRLLTQVAHFPSRLGECVVQQPLEVPPPSASAIAELSGLSGGYISLLAPLTVCAELVAAMIGEPVEANNRTGIEDGLTEFLNLVGGDLVARVAEDAHTLEVMLPRPGGLPELSRTDHLVAARLHVPGGDLVLSVLTRLG